MKYPNEPHYKDNDGYIAPLSEWLTMIEESRSEYPNAAYAQEPEEYIGSLIPVTKINGQWQEMDK